MSNEPQRFDSEFHGKQVHVGRSWAAWKEKLEDVAASAVFLEIVVPSDENGGVPPEGSAPGGHKAPLYQRLMAAVDAPDHVVFTSRKIEPASNHGKSFVLEAAPGSALPDLFLKLSGGPGDDIVAFSEEIENLREINALEKLTVRGRTPSQVGHVAQVISRATLFYGDKGIPALLEEYVSGASLDKYVAEVRVDFERAKQLWLVLAFTLTNVVRRLHNRGIIHGWIQPRHVILGAAWRRVGNRAITPKYCAALMNDVHLVGFGTSALLFDPDRVGVVQRAMAADVYAAPEVKKAGRLEGLFSYPVDLYSLGKNLLMFAIMLLAEKGAHCDDRLTTIARCATVDLLKRQVSKLMADSGWVSESFARVIDKALRVDQADRYLCAEEMLQFILNAATPRMRSMLLGALLDKDEIERPLSEIRSALVSRGGTGAGPKGNEFLPEFFRNRLYEAAIWQGLSSENGHLEVYGSRDVLLDSLCSFMGLLSPGDEYCTRTFPAYWTDRNLGVNGRFLVINKDLAKRGVKVRRLFMVSYDFHELPIDEQMVMLHQRQACTDVWERLGNAGERVNYSVRVKKVGSFRELLKGERRKQFVAYVKFGPKSKWKGQYVGFSFMSYGIPYREFNQEHHRMQITKLRFRVLGDGEDSVKAFNMATDWNNPDSDDNIENYLNSGAALSALTRGSARS